jgi:hypothetical protein
MIWPYTQIVDADVSSRIFIAQELVENCKLIYEGVWLPLHHYLNAAMIMLSKKPLSGPIFIHLLLSCAAAVPIYYFTKREFNQNGAWIATILYLTCPIIFRNSFHALSEIPYVFFVACSLNMVSLSLRTDAFKHVIYAGLFSTLAAGFRYEAWVLIAVFTFMYILKKQWKLGVVFASVAILFPVYWMVGNQIAHNQLFYGVTGVYNSDVVQLQNKMINSVEYIKRILFFPISWFFFMSPIILVLLSITILKKRQLTRGKLIWLLPFFVMLLFFLFKAINGTLLLQHRFSISLLVLTIPFTALLGMIHWTRFRKVVFITLLLAQLPLSTIWMRVPFEYIAGSGNKVNQALKEIRLNSLSEFECIPRLQNQETIKINNDITSRIQKGEGLVLDFTGWENTYFLAIESNVKRNNIYIVDTELSSDKYVDDIRDFILKHPNGLIQLNCFSVFSSVWVNKGVYLILNSDLPIHIELKKISRTVSSGLFRYKLIDSLINQDVGNDLIQCPKENSIEWFISRIYADKNWYNSIKASALRNGETIEEAIQKNAEWMFNDVQ